MRLRGRALRGPVFRVLEGSRSETTSAELFETAIAMRPTLLRRALELTRGHYADAEDLVGETYLALVRKPPEPRDEAALRRWLRTVVKRRALDRAREWARRVDEGLVEVPLGEVPEGAIFV